MNRVGPTASTEWPTRLQAALRLVARRLLALATTLVLVSAVAFAVLGRRPGEEHAGVFSPSREASGSVLIRYGQWLLGALRLDLGLSWQDGRAVSAHIAELIPMTITLAVSALLLAHAIAVPLAVECAGRAGRTLDRTVNAFALALESVPSYWIGSVLLVVFTGGAHLGWFPVLGASSEGAEAWPLIPFLLDRAWHLVLPVACLMLALLATIFRVCRSALEEALRQDFTVAALAKGAGRRTVLWRHGVRHAAAPLVALASSLVGPLLGGTAVVESLFGLPGVGLAAWQAAVARDAPVLLGLLWVMALVVSMALMAADVGQVLLDPRVRGQNHAG